MKLCAVITLSREKGCLSTGHFGEWLQKGKKEKKRKKKKKKKKEKKSENKQGFKKIVHRVYYLLLFTMKRFASLSHILLREEP